MVQLAHIFKKDKDKEKDKAKDRERDISKDPSTHSPRSSFSAARKSPSKSSTSTSPSKKSPSKSSPTKASPTKTRFSHSRSSSNTTSAPSFKFGRASRDQDLHPLNLPPDELHRRLSAMADQRSSMDIDPQDVQMKNGVNGEERSPTPPPHKSTSSSDEAESFKLAGNKFFKDGNYKRAIEEYNKGMPFFFFFVPARTGGDYL